MSTPTLAVNTIAEYMLNVSWHCIETSWASVNPQFQVIAPTKLDLSSLFHALGFKFRHGLLDVVRATNPPPITWFETLPDDVSKKHWGIYVLVLQKEGCRPGLYIGSGTDATDGVAHRVKSYYWPSTSTPSYVRKYQQNGYSIVHHSLLAWCQIPSPGQAPRFRAAVLILEAAFTSLFWALHRRDMSYGLDFTCPWPRDLFEWDGLCSHSPLKEAIRANEHGFGLSPEELQKIAVLRRRRHRYTRYHYARDYRRKNKDKLRRCGREYYRKNRDRWRYYQREYRQKHGDRMRCYKRIYRQKNGHRMRCYEREYRQKNGDRMRQHHREYRQRKIHSRGILCEPCGKSFVSLSKLATHEKSAAHIKNTPHLGHVESRIKARDETAAFKCEPCGMSFDCSSKMATHEKSTAHIKNTPHLGDVESRIKARDEMAAFKCEPCGKSFTRREHLAKHEKSAAHIKNTPHLGDVESRIKARDETAAFKCEPCGKSFDCSSKMATHEKSTAHIKLTMSVAELEDMPYKCYACRYFTRRSYDFRQHQRKTSQQ